MTPDRETDFETVYTRERGQVFAYLLKRTRDWHLAEDLTAEVFIVAFRREWHDRGIPYSHYLTRIAHWEFNNYARREWRRPVFRLNAEDERSDALSSDGGIDALLNACHTATMAALLLPAVQRLKPRQLRALSLRYGAGLPLAVGARRMKLSQEAYRAVVRQSLERLQALLFGGVERETPQVDPPALCACGADHYARGMCRGCYKHWRKAEIRRRTEAARV